VAGHAHGAAVVAGASVVVVVVGAAVVVVGRAVVVVGFAVVVVVGLAVVVVVVVSVVDEVDEVVVVSGPFEPLLATSAMTATTIRVISTAIMTAAQVGTFWAGGSGVVGDDGVLRVGRLVGHCCLLVAGAGRARVGSDGSCWPRPASGFHCLSGGTTRRRRTDRA